MNIKEVLSSISTLLETYRINTLEFAVLLIISTENEQHANKNILLNYLIDRINCELKLSKKKAGLVIQELKKKHYIHIIDWSRDEQGKFISPEVILTTDSPNNNKTKQQIKHKQVMQPPTLDEIEQFIQDNNLKVNGREFYIYYESNNWKTTRGLSILDSWQSKLKIWDKNTYDRTPGFLDYCEKHNDTILDEMELLLQREVHNSYLQS